MKYARFTIVYTAGTTKVYAIIVGMGLEFRISLFPVMDCNVFHVKLIVKCVILMLLVAHNVCHHFSLKIPNAFNASMAVLTVQTHQYVFNVLEATTYWMGHALCAITNALNVNHFKFVSLAFPDFISSSNINFPIAIKFVGMELYMTSVATIK